MIAQRLIHDLAYRRTHNQHAVLGIGGPPGAGKSTLGLGIALSLQPDFPLSNVHYNRDEWHEIVNAEKGQIFLLDEGNNVASNRTWQDRGQVALMQILNMIRQRNHILIWATPNVQRLDVIVRDDLLTHKINCIPHKWSARVRTPRFDRDGEQAGWGTWKGYLKWPQLNTHPIWPGYEAAKERNYLDKVASMPVPKTVDPAVSFAVHPERRNTNRDPVTHKFIKKPKTAPEPVPIDAIS